MNLNDINLKEYDYDLPAGRIARYPAEERDLSRLLIYKDNRISVDIFRNIDKHIHEGSLLVFNDTRVIRARLLFTKETGALIEVLCLEPLAPSEYESSLGSVEPVEWKCIVGNLKKWKQGTIRTPYIIEGASFNLSAKRIREEGEAWRIRFEWNSPGISFGEVIDAAGKLPLPPYLEREADTEDLNRYQTVYSRTKGSVAAPTAGLHFTDRQFARFRESGISAAEVTLHVGAGTFKPIKSEYITEHEMHCEHFSLSRETVELLLNHTGQIIAVGTTSVRTLESLYWLGVKFKRKPDLSPAGLSIGQWEAYESETEISPGEAIESILEFMTINHLPVLHASTSIMIIPGYKFRMLRAMITNFHQPMSTLLLLVSAWVSERWKEIYSFALRNNFRFLSYGDSSLLFMQDTDL